MLTDATDIPCRQDPPGTPSTRYYGSKYKLLDWIWGHLAPLEFESVLDAFGGSACVAHMLKRRLKQVTCNDALRCNYVTALALIENSHRRLTTDEIRNLLQRRPDQRYDDFIARTFHDIYFLPEENRWLDVVAQNIARMTDRHAAALAWLALFQSALAKRPYNLFHRRNLYMRTARVERGFGNKTTWDRPFHEHFTAFAAEAGAAVFDSGIPCRACNADALRVPGRYDLVYIDPPYVNARGVGVDYLGYYHFLEGLLDYERWPERIDYASKHRRIHRHPSPWTNPKEVHGALTALFERFADSTLVMSYRSDGIPSRSQLLRAMKRVKPTVRVYHPKKRYRYVLSTNRRGTELLLIGTS